MPEKPSWLPEMITAETVDDALIKRLYSTFYLDFEIGRPRFRGLSVWWNRSEVGTPFGNLGYTFWHLVSREDQKTGIRAFDLERARRLPWCFAIITNSTQPELKIWDRPEPSGNPKTHLWLENFDYLVILQKQQRRREEIAFLISGFYVDQHRKKQLLESHKNANTAP